MNFKSFFTLLKMVILLCKTGVRANTFPWMCRQRVEERKVLSKGELCTSYLMFYIYLDNRDVHLWAFFEPQKHKKVGEKRTEYTAKLSHPIPSLFIIEYLWRKNLFLPSLWYEKNFQSIIVSIFMPKKINDFEGMRNKFFSLIFRLEVATFFISKRNTSKPGLG